MKIVINETGKLEKVSKRVASRLINKGKAHYPEKQKGGIVLPQKIPKLNNDLIIPPETKKEPEDFSAELKTFRRNYNELAEPIKKPKRRYRKKKSKFKEVEWLK